MPEMLSQENKIKINAMLEKWIHTTEQIQIHVKKLLLSVVLRLIFFSIFMFFVYKSYELLGFAHTIIFLLGVMVYNASTKR